MFGLIIHRKSALFLERISVSVLKFGHEGHTCLWVKLSSKNDRYCQEGDQRIFGLQLRD
jgi:hypothetical protein